MYLVTFKEDTYGNSDWLTVLVHAATFELAQRKITQHYPEACYFKNLTIE